MIYQVFTVVTLYMVLLCMVVLGFEDALKLYGALFLIINSFFSICIIAVMSRASEHLYHYIIYGTFLLVYIVKAVVQYFSGLDTAYVITTLRVEISNQGYIDSLIFVSVAHAVFLIYILLGNLMYPQDKEIKNMYFIGVSYQRLILLFVFVFISFSTAVMLVFGVAVMGTQGVSLPFKLSGILYYGRAVIVPLLLLFLVQQGYLQRNSRLIKSAMLLLIYLSLCEILVRASKAPLLYLGLQLFVLHYLLLEKIRPVTTVLGRKGLFLLVCCAVALWPFVEIYRSLVVTNAELSTFAVELADYDDQSIILYSIERLFQRLLGFLQLAGLLSDAVFNHSLSTVFSYDSLARYYTQGYLGYMQEGHLSSPSLLGAVYILFGYFWPFGFLFFLLFSRVMWRGASSLGALSFPLRSFIIIPIVNCMIAGTIDFMFKDILMALFISIVLRFLFDSSRSA